MKQLCAKVLYPVLVNDKEIVALDFLRKTRFILISPSIVPAKQHSPTRSHLKHFQDQEV